MIDGLLILIKQSIRNLSTITEQHKSKLLTLLMADCEYSKTENSKTNT